MPPRRPGPPPRDWIEHDEPRQPWAKTGFGDVEPSRLAWKTPSTRDEAALLAAAQNQHALAMQINDWIRRDGHNLAAVAKAVDMSPTLLRDILHGRTHVYLADLHRIGAVLNLPLASTYMDPRFKRRSDTRG